MRPPKPARPATPAESTDDTSVLPLFRAVLDASSRLKRDSMEGISTAIEGVARAFARRYVTTSFESPRIVPDSKSLAHELDKPMESLKFGSTATALLATKLAQRLGLVRMLGNRTPLWLVSAGVPAVVNSMRRGGDEIALVASHLVLRAREAGIEPDPDRVRRAAVQVLSGSPVQPGVEPLHGRLVVSWLRRAARAAMPFTKGVKTARPKRLSDAAGAVPVVSLAGPLDGGSGQASLN